MAPFVQMQCPWRSTLENITVPEPIATIVNVITAGRNETIGIVDITTRNGVETTSGSIEIDMEEIGPGTMTGRETGRGILIGTMDDPAIGITGTAGIAMIVETVVIVSEAEIGRAMVESGTMDASVMTETGSSDPTDPDHRQGLWTIAKGAQHQPPEVV